MQISNPELELVHVMKLNEVSKEYERDTKPDPKPR
jgi:hypothetical protein